MKGRSSADFENIATYVWFWKYRLLYLGSDYRLGEFIFHGAWRFDSVKLILNLLQTGVQFLIFLCVSNCLLPSPPPPPPPRRDSPAGGLPYNGKTLWNVYGTALREITLAIQNRETPPYPLLFQILYIILTTLFYFYIAFIQFETGARVRNFP